MKTVCKLPLPVRVGLTRKARLSRRHAPRERVVVLYSWCKRNLFTRLCCKYNGVRVSRVPVHKELVNFLCCVLFTAVESLCKQLDAISVCTIRKITDGYVKQDCACTHLSHRLGLISLVPLAADWNSANWRLFFLFVFFFSKWKAILRGRLLEHFECVICFAVKKWPSIFKHQRLQKKTF